MPICEADPWRRQYFADVACPPDVRIPTEDADAWCWYPELRWVYDRLAIALDQGLLAAPHGVVPPVFPVFSKPIVNLRGMGVGSRVLRDREDYERHLAPGHMWMPRLRGEHLSTDVALDRGRPVWWRHVRGVPRAGGTFDHWRIEAAARPALEARLAAWIGDRFAGWSGMLNLETIGGVIIEAHLRFSDQWPDLYGPGWVEALVGLYAGRGWRFADADRRDGWSVVLFGPHGVRWRHPPAGLLARLRAVPGISSIQITFHEDREPERHAMPPGGFRLAIVNAFAPGPAFAVRARLAAWFRGPAARRDPPRPASAGVTPGPRPAGCWGSPAAGCRDPTTP